MTELHNEFAYSCSRSDSFYQCPRRFYWQHYGFWLGWEDDAPREAQIAYRLKHIRSLAMLIGDVVHAVISDALRARPDHPVGVPADAMQHDAEAGLREHLAASRERRWKSGSPKYYTNLFEDYYGPGLSSQETREAFEVVRDCVAGFAKSGFGKRAFGVEKSHLRLIDPEAFDDKRAVLDGLTVYAPTDLLVEGKDGASLHIVDWKTGRQHQASLAQLAVYGLAVSAKHHVPIAKLTAHLVYVRNGAHEEYRDLTAGVEEARRAIDTFVRDVQGRLTDITTNTAGDIEKFPMTTQVWKCRSCKFRELCGRMGEPALVPAEELETD